jgi:6-phosphofructokinase
LHPEFFNWFPAFKTRRDRVLLSDFVLKRQNFAQVVSQINEQKIRKVVIIGGSHSGFSAAWLLLNGPADLFANCSRKTEPA